MFSSLVSSMLHASRGLQFAFQRNKENETCSLHADSRERVYKETERGAKIVTVVASICAVYKCTLRVAHYRKKA